MLLNNKLVAQYEELGILLLKAVSVEEKALIARKIALLSKNSISVLENLKISEIEYPQGMQQEVEGPIGEIYKLIPGGIFVQGCFENAKHGTSSWQVPPNIVRLDHFYYGETLVTNSQYYQVTNIKPYEYESRKNYPVFDMTFSAAADYCKLLTLLSDKITNKEKTKFEKMSGIDFLDYVTINRISGAFRLDTEAEFEFVAKGKDRFKFGHDIKVSIEDIYRNDKPVKKEAPNYYGVYDLLGLIPTLKYDRYSNDLSEFSAENPIGYDKGNEESGHHLRVVKKGLGVTNGEMSNHRGHLGTNNSTQAGFRVVMNP